MQNACKEFFAGYAQPAGGRNTLRLLLFSFFNGCRVKKFRVFQPFQCQNALRVLCVNRSARICLQILATECE